MIVALNTMSKKLFSRNKSNKLVTDASVLDENNSNGNDSSDRAQSESLSVSPLSQEMGVSRRFDNQSMSVLPTNDLLAEPPSALSLNSTQQTFYQFSNVRGIHIGPSIKITHKTEQSSERRSTAQSISKIPRTHTIDIMMKSKDPVNVKIMDVISTHLGENWRFLFRNHLGFTDGQIDQMKENFYINGVKEVIYRLLLDYSRNNDDASLGHITTIMWENGFIECVKMLKIYYKKGKLGLGETSNSSNEKNDEPSCSKGKNVD